MSRKKSRFQVEMRSTKPYPPSMQTKNRNTSGPSLATSLAVPIRSRGQTKIKQILVVLLSITLFNALSAQSKIKINDYGSYFIETGKAMRIQTKDVLSSARGFENFFILDVDASLSFYIFNIENQKMSEVLLGTPIPILGTPKLTFEMEEYRNGRVVGHIEVDFDPDTMEIVEKRSSGGGRFYTDWQWDWLPSQRLSQNTFSYKGKDGSLEIEYGKNIDLSIEDALVVYAAGKGQYFVFVSKHPFDRGGP